MGCKYICDNCGKEEDGEFDQGGMTDSSFNLPYTAKEWSCFKNGLISCSGICRKKVEDNHAKFLRRKQYEELKKEFENES